jgi:hypothetical protein
MDHAVCKRLGRRGAGAGLRGGRVPGGGYGAKEQQYGKLARDCAAFQYDQKMATAYAKYAG